MKRRRKTPLERRQERQRAETAAWDDFRPKLEAIQSYAEASELVSHAPPVDSPGRGLYSNLGFFLQSFIPPDGATAAEKSIYITLIQRMNANGELKPGVQQRVAESLQRAISEQYW